jgi:hypothetical protein
MSNKIAKAPLRMAILPGVIHPACPDQYFCNLHQTAGADHGLVRELMRQRF